MIGGGEVRIGRESAYLGLSPVPPTGLRARLVLPDFDAETDVHLTVPELEMDIGTFFADMAIDWRGWNGLREWKTYEGGLTLTCSHDGMGHVSIAVRLRQFSGHGWLASGDVLVDAGQLDQLAREIAPLVAT